MIYDKEQSKRDNRSFEKWWESVKKDLAVSALISPAVSDVGATLNAIERVAYEAWWDGWEDGYSEARYG
ncbi:MAG: hypothetical protein M0R80_08040 [Proteobacteria bacterium]|jgi:hypothetical protein|nr:hypothetical protein [Pseudomonadota bacterium]